MNQKLIQYFQNTENLLWYQYQRSVELNHSTTKGNLREIFVAEFIKKCFPKKFVIGSGIIIDKNGKQSKQVDIVLYDEYLPILDYGSGAENAQYLAEGVFATIEVKSDLNTQHLESALENTKSIKELNNQKSPVGGFDIEISSNKKLDTKIKSFWFCYSGMNLEHLIESMKQVSYDLIPDNSLFPECIMVMNKYVLLKKSRIERTEENGEIKEEILIEFDHKAYCEKNSILLCQFFNEINTALQKTTFIPISISGHFTN